MATAHRYGDRQLKALHPPIAIVHHPLA